MVTTSLNLEEGSLDPSALSMSALTREIVLQKRPHWMLCRIMDALERKRQEAGHGWSRKWNKVGLTIFRAHQSDRVQDAAYFTAMRPLIDRLLQQVEEPYNSFARQLLDDPEAMTFSFYHNGGQEHGAAEQHEGVTIGLGRRVADEPRKRDRLDLILEDRREGDSVDGVIDRVRLYVCPWSEYREKRFVTVEEKGRFESGDVEVAYRAATEAYNHWKTVEDRQFLHWSARYINYFGRRTFIPKGSAFT
jgi:hypothetical protein